MDQNDDAGKYLQQAFGGTGEGLALQAFTGDQAAAALVRMRNWLERIHPPADVRAQDFQRLADAALAELATNPEAVKQGMAAGTRDVLLHRVGVAVSVCMTHPALPVIRCPPGCADLHLAVAAVLRSEQLPRRLG